MGLTQDFFKWLLLPWVLECVEICVCSLFPTASGSPKSKSRWPSQPDVRDLSSGQGLWAEESVWGFLGPCSPSSFRSNYSFPPFGGCPPRVWALTALASHTSHSVLLWFLVSLVVEDLFCWSSVLFLFL